MAKTFDTHCYQSESCASGFSAIGSQKWLYFATQFGETINKIKSLYFDDLKRTVDFKLKILYLKAIKAIYV